jgi:hypothetical protein
MIAYIVSHNGLGDNLFMNGGIRFICNFYDKVIFICKNKWIDNVSDFYTDVKNINFKTITVDDEINNILTEDLYKNSNVDIFVCGIHKRRKSSKITNSIFLNYKKKNETYTIGYDTIEKENYSFIKFFYNDMKLNLNYFFENFYLPTTEESIRLYNLVNKYYIIFIQLTCSGNQSLNISNLLNKYINDDKSIILCSQKNLYNNQKDNVKYEIANNFVLNKIINYIEVIKNSNEIYIIDSAFTGLVLPYVKTNQLKADIVRIIDRRQVNKYVL